MMRKLMAVLMALAMVCVMAVPAFAADTPSETPTVLEDPATGIVLESSKDLGEGLELVVMPEAASEELKGKITEGTILGVFDIFVEKIDTHEKVQLNNVSVTLKVPKSALGNKAYKFYQAVYVPTAEKIAAVADVNYVSFTVTHLSEYAIIGSDTEFTTGGSTGEGSNSGATAPVTSTFTYMLVIGGAVVLCTVGALVSVKKAKESR